ncbi:MAG TPA: hypothetical protein VM094_07660 [Gemmatimonadales bacterium]|nr:hypothetical protein [Gemmatimonadales bacterium]
MMDGAPPYINTVVIRQAREHTSCVLPRRLGWNQDSLHLEEGLHEALQSALLFFHPGANLELQPHG